MRMRHHAVGSAALAAAALFSFLSPNSAEAREPVRAKRAMVVSREALATEAGVAVLRKGGNAIDAAVAVGFVLSVTHPAAGNIGGGGFMLIRFADGRTTFLDFRERAPLAASAGMYLGPDGMPTRDSIEGWRAAGVPGSVKGLEVAARKYGKLPWSSLVSPAVKLAREGFPISHDLARSLHSSRQLLGRFPESNRIFLRQGRLYEPGDRLLQPELASTLERIARQGSRDFYQGETARRLAAAMQANGGLITLQDLRDYEVLERKPLEGEFRGYRILTAPPPSSGGVGILQMLAMLDPLPFAEPGAGSAQSIHYIAEVMRRYYADRSEHLADPGFFQVPVARLLDAGYIARRRASIQPDRTTPSHSLLPGPFANHTAEPSSTTHYSIVDEQGNAVAVTYTLNGSYGSGVTVPGLGFLLNNEMDDFTAKPGVPNLFGLVQGKANAIEPGKRPLSSMTPTIVLREGKLFLVLGSPGGSRIINTVLQVLLNVTVFGMNIREAVDQPRVHHQWMPDQLLLEPGISPDTIAALRARGHVTRPVKALGHVCAILLDAGWLQGANDSRSDGKAEGY
jgi:gamma-glutamyltranspeptidase / glutathione hydrolase